MGSKVDKAIKQRVKELKIDVMYSKKGHYNAASIWNSVHYAIGCATVIVAAIVGVKNTQLSQSLVVVLSLSAAALGAVSTFLKPQEKATQHKLSGDDFDDLLQQIANFNQVEMLQGTDAEHTERLQVLSTQKTDLNKGSLPIPRIAYIKTRKGVNDGEAEYTENV